MKATEILMLTLQISLFIMALGYGLKATPSDAFYLFRHPGHLVRSIVAMNIIMPLVAVSMALLLDLPPLVKVAFIAISVSPLAPLFPKQPLKAGARNAYVIGVMVTAAIFSIVLIPVTLVLLENMIQKQVGFSTRTILLTVLVTVIVPLLSGVFIHYFFPVFAGKIASPMARISPVLLVVSFLPILYKIIPGILKLIGNGTALAIVAFVIIGFFVGHFLGGPANEDRTVLALATAARHPAIAISVATANLTEHSLVPAAMVLYLFINALVALPYLKWFGKGKTELLL